MSSSSRPAWWPVASKGELALLDVRDGMCSISFLKANGGLLAHHSEPAVLRRSSQDGGADFSHWGRRALAWRDRLPVGGGVLDVFPGGWPMETAVARWYLKKFHETYMPKRGAFKVQIVEPDKRSWARQLWRETLEDSPLSAHGFLTPWQHDVLMAREGEPKYSLSPYLHFCLGAQQTTWQLINDGVPQAEGSDVGLSRNRLLAQLADYLRRRASTDLGSGALHNLLQASAMDGVSEELVLPIAGRQIYSGLPTRQTFSWPEFLATRPSVVESWQRVRRRIFKQAEELLGPLGKGREGLDLPGWRVLTSGSLAHLFVEGPVVRLMDELR